MKDFIKGILRFYFHHSQAYTLMTLPLNGLGALSSILVLFTVVSGMKFDWWVYVALFAIATLVLFGVGTLARKAGFLAYWQSLGNSQNPELMQIYRKVGTLQNPVNLATIIPEDKPDPFAEIQP